MSAMIMEQLMELATNARRNSAATRMMGSLFIAEVLDFLATCSDSTSDRDLDKPRLVALMEAVDLLLDGLSMALMTMTMMMPIVEEEEEQAEATDVDRIAVDGHPGPVAPAEGEKSLPLPLPVGLGMLLHRIRCHLPLLLGEGRFTSIATATATASSNTACSTTADRTSDDARQAKWKKLVERWMQAHAMTTSMQQSHRCQDDPMGDCFYHAELCRMLGSGSSGGGGGGGDGERNAVLRFDTLRPLLCRLEATSPRTCRSFSTTSTVSTRGMFLAVRLASVPFLDASMMDSVMSGSSGRMLSFGFECCCLSSSLLLQQKTASMEQNVAIYGQVHSVSGRRCRDIGDGKVEDVMLQSVLWSPSAVVLRKRGCLLGLLVLVSSSTSLPEGGDSGTMTVVLFSSLDASGSNRFRRLGQPVAVAAPPLLGNGGGFGRLQWNVLVEGSLGVQVEVMEELPDGLQIPSFSPTIATTSTTTPSPATVLL